LPLTARTHSRATTTMMGWVAVPAVVVVVVRPPTWHVGRSRGQPTCALANHGAAAWPHTDRSPSFAACPVRPAARHMCSGHHRRRPAGRVIELQRAGGRQVGRARPHNQMIGEANRVVCGLPASLSSLAFLVGCLRLRLLSYTRTLDLATTVVGVISWWY
jgi:hypothetical protein